MKSTNTRSSNSGAFKSQNVNQSGKTLAAKSGNVVPKKSGSKAEPMFQIVRLADGSYIRVMRKDAFKKAADSVKKG